jgi:hypothetical protein
MASEFARGITFRGRGSGAHGGFLGFEKRKRRPSRKVLRYVDETFFALSVF